MSSQIPRAVLQQLASLARQNPNKIRNLDFGSVTAQTLYTTQDLRLDVHKVSSDPRLATGIVQANSQSQNEAVRQYIRGSTGGHQGTHQVIAKFNFYIGAYANIDDVVSNIENAVGTQGAAAAPVAGHSSASQSGWTFHEQYKNYYRTNNGTTEWWARPKDAQVDQWMYIQEFRRHGVLLGNGTGQWH